MDLYATKGELVGGAIYYAGAMVAEAARVGGTLVSTQTVAVGYLALAAIERGVRVIAEKTVPNSPVGPSGIGLQTAVSWGFSTYLTMKVMQVAGLILSIHPVVGGIGLVTGVVLATASALAWIGPPPRSESEMEKFLQSGQFENSVFKMEHENKAHYVRIICNPEGKSITLPDDTNTSRKFIVIADAGLPGSLKLKLADKLASQLRCWQTNLWTYYAQYLEVGHQQMADVAEA